MAMFAARNRRRVAARSAALLFALPALLGGCAFDAADQFAQQYGQYLDTRDDIASFRLSPNNAILSRGSVDSQITLNDGMSDTQVAATARELVEHHVDTKIDEHRIRLFFDAHNPAGQAASVSIQLQPGSAVSRMSDPSQYLQWVSRTRALAADTEGLKSIMVFKDAIHLDTSSEAVQAAEHLNAFVGVNPAGISYQNVGATDCNLQWDTDDDISKLFVYRDVLALLPPGVQPLHCRITSQRPITEPNFEAVLPRDTSDQVVTAMRARAAELALPADITVAP
ncbi:hypothetical protein [Gordonia sp. (in: high G+C Gram-positive bacteria)]|uniref:hypothetical protein n=2 Tax=Gordonia sp. (in: high G+C Gram-positive bacteria) TaxID=84139 RepID=UPI003C78C532